MPDHLQLHSYLFIWFVKLLGGTLLPVWVLRPMITAIKRRLISVIQLLKPPLNIQSHTRDITDNTYKAIDRYLAPIQIISWLSMYNKCLTILKRSSVQLLLDTPVGVGGKAGGRSVMMTFQRIRSLWSQAESMKKLSYLFDEVVTERLIRPHLLIIAIWQFR